MRSLRLDNELEQRLLRAAQVAGESFSEFVRRAAADRADAVLHATDRDEFADVLGVVHGGGGRARDTGRAFTDLLEDRKQTS